VQVQVSLLLDRSRPDTLTAQLVSQFKEAIRVGRIAPGVRLPSSRRLSEQLGIGRNTVVRAYETLEIECYVESRPASGMFATTPPVPRGPVPRRPPDRTGDRTPRIALSGQTLSARTLSAQTLSAQTLSGQTQACHPLPSRTLSAPALSVQTLAGQTTLETRQSVSAAGRARLSFDFSPGLANANLFPIKTWRRLLQAALARGGGAGLTRPVDLFGLPALRSAIASHLGAARGVIAEPGQIVIVSGAREAIAIATRLFVTAGSLVCLENPSYRPAAAGFQTAGAELLALPVDEAGIAAEELPARAAALLYVTPSHQYPTGHAISPFRREQIADWACRFGCMILEDDRGSDFRYEGGSPQAIAAYAAERTCYFATFSQSLGAGSRLGYMVVPGAFVDAARAVKASLNGGCSWLEQAALADMIEGGAFASHLMRMRVEYRARRDQLLDALRRNFGEPDVSGESGGLHVFWQLPPGVPDAATVEALGRRARVGVCSLQSGNVYHAGQSALSRRGLMLGYAALTPKQIDQGIARLSDALDDALDGHAIGLHDLLAHRPLPPRVPASALLRRTKPVPRPKPVPRFRQQPALPAPPAARAASGAAAEQGSDLSMMVVTALYHYPVKGLSPQPLRTVRVEAGKPFPFDRVFALARPGVAVTREQPKWAKKGLFVMLMLDEGLASVRTHLDEDTLLLTVREGAPGGKLLLSARLDDEAGRRDVEAFFHRLAPTLRSEPALVRARDGHFMDKPDNVISLINLATVRSLEGQWGYSIDPLRFRANIYVDGVPPWSEFEWVGGDLRIGSAIFNVDRRNGRCSATNVDPASGRRDLDIPGSLRRAFGHKDLGVYLVARANAELAVRDRVVPEAQAVARKAAVAAIPATGRGAYICRGCYFVYGEAQGLPLAGIPPGTRFADLPANWQCPDCGTGKTTFRVHMTVP
jgi:GntR family transcriptional regulator/MocR family aminotransferase